MNTIKERLPFGKQVEIALIKEDKTKAWLANELNIAPGTLSYKLRDNLFTVGEIYLVSNLLKIEA